MREVSYGGGTTTTAAATDTHTHAHEQRARQKSGKSGQKPGDEHIISQRSSAALDGHARAGPTEGTARCPLTNWFAMSDPTPSRASLFNQRLPYP